LRFVLEIKFKNYKASIPPNELLRNWR